jgi:hypothetical protein
MADITVNGSAMSLDGISSKANSISSVVGTTADSHTDVTIFGKLVGLEQDNHGVDLVIPTLAAGVTVSSCIAAWTLGAKISLGTSVIASEFGLHFMNIEDLSDVDIHEFHIFKGATTGGTVVAKVRGTKSANQDTIPHVPMLTPHFVANQKTFVRMANLTAAASTATLSFNYHIHS